MIQIRDDNLTEIIISFHSSSLHSAASNGTFVSLLSDLALTTIFFSLSQTLVCLKFLQNDERPFQPALNRLSESLAREHV